jgi:hypothetical protein
VLLLICVTWPNFLSRLQRSFPYCIDYLGLAAQAVISWRFSAPGSIRVHWYPFAVRKILAEKQDFHVEKLGGRRSVAAEFRDLGLNLRIHSFTPALKPGDSRSLPEVSAPS